MTKHKAQSSKGEGEAMRRQKRNPLAANMGSVSWGTMRPEDLIPAFMDCLGGQKPLRHAHRKLLTTIQKQIADQGEGYWTGDAPFDLDELYNALNEYCLPYFYFGAHPEDGADYGFWLPESFVDDFEGLKVSDLSEVPIRHSGEVLLVNDHGNVSLYTYSRGRSREIWSIV